MNFTLAQLAAYLKEQGMPCEIRGDENRCIAAVATLEEATPSQISFLANPKYEKMLGTTQAGAVVIRKGQDAPDNVNLLVVADAYAAITLLIIKIHGFRRHRHVGISDQAHIASSARLGKNPNVWPFVSIADNVQIGDNAIIYPGCFIAEGCKLGDDVVLMPNVVLYEGVTLGNRVTVHAGTVVGEDGLGYAPVGQNWAKIPQVGTVEIGDDVEIGANCSIDRATLGRTIIANGTKFSNLIAIGHGCRIGENCLFVAQVGVAGSVTVGNHVTMAGQVGVVGHINVGDNATLAAKAGVTHDVPPGAVYLGAPATSIEKKKREWASLTKLPDMRQKLRKLETLVEQRCNRKSTSSRPGELRKRETSMNHGDTETRRTTQIGDTTSVSACLCDKNDPLGVIAGAGSFPFEVAQGARREGRRVVIIGLRGFADPGLRDLADAFYWSGVVRLGSWKRIFAKEGVREAVMAGRVRKSDMYGRFRHLRFLPDLTSLKVWYRKAKDKRNDTVLQAAADELAAGGVTLIDSTRYCPRILIEAGVLTDAAPSDHQWQDIHFGWRIAKEMGRLDIGQSIAVKEKEVIAVEAVEGTDEMIRRAGHLCKQGGWTLVKVAKPNQDMRFDVPSIGPATMDNMHANGGRVLAVEAGKTLFLDRDTTLRLAGQYGIIIVAMAGAASTE